MRCRCREKRISMLSGGRQPSLSGTKREREREIVMGRDLGRVCKSSEKKKPAFPERETHFRSLFASIPCAEIYFHPAHFPSGSAFPIGTRPPSYLYDFVARRLIIDRFQLLYEKRKKSYEGSAQLTLSCSYLH